MKRYQIEFDIDKAIDIIETKVLPLVLAFAAGVLVHDVMDEHRYMDLLDQAKHALVAAQAYADACGPGVAVSDIAPEHAQWEGKR